MNTLLLIIDVQEQFMARADEGLRFCEKIEKLQDDYGHVAISRFVNNQQTFWVKYLEWNKMMEGDDGTKLAIKPKEGAFIYKNDTFSSVNKSLKSYLDKNNIEEIHLCGVDTDACILGTAFALWDLKISFKILIDHCISSAGENIHSGAQHIMNKNFGFNVVVTSEKPEHS